MGCPVVRILSETRVSNVGLLLTGTERRRSASWIRRSVVSLLTPQTHLLPGLWQQQPKSSTAAGVLVVTSADRTERQAHSWVHSRTKSPCASCFHSCTLRGGTCPCERNGSVRIASLDGLWARWGRVHGLRGVQDISRGSPCMIRRHVRCDMQDTMREINVPACVQLLTRCPRIHDWQAHFWPSTIMALMSNARDREYARYTGRVNALGCPTDRLRADDREPGTGDEVQQRVVAGREG